MMAGGWAKDGAVQEQIDASVKDAINQARSRLNIGDSLLECEECGVAIAEARRKALLGVRTCITCQQEQDRETHVKVSINRRGSKDSQLR